MTSFTNSQLFDEISFFEETNDYDHNHDDFQLTSKLLRNQISLKSSDYNITLNISTFNQIHCHDDNDFYLLLYKLCVQSTICSELLFLDRSVDQIMTLSSNTIIEQNDFKKFVYQLSPFQLFLMNNYNNDGKFINQNKTILFIYKMWPQTWCPNYIINLNNTLPPFTCSSLITSETMKTSMAINDRMRDFIHVAIYSIETYKIHISNEHYCHHHNQHLIFDLVNNKALCICMVGKSCNDESNTENFYIVIISLYSSLLIIWTITQIMSTLKMSNYASRLV
jgi:hypothetical protein